MCLPKYFFIWSLILGEIVVFLTSSPSISCDSIDATDHALPTPPLPFLEACPCRSPNHGGSVFADRSEDGILVGGSGGSPVLSVCPSRVEDAMPDATLSEE